MPNESHICDEKCPQVTLKQQDKAERAVQWQQYLSLVSYPQCQSRQHKTDLVRREIPDSVYFVVNLLLRQEPERLVVDKCSPQLQLSVHFGRLISSGNDLLIERQQMKYTKSLDIS